MHSFGRLAIVAAALVLGSLQAPPVRAAVIHVGTNGADVPGCGSLRDKCLTTQGGVNQAVNGDTVFCHEKANFRKAVVAGKSITIDGCWVLETGGDPCFRIDGGPGAFVEIINVLCDQTGAAADGIAFNSGGNLRVKRTEILGAKLAGRCGIRFQTTSDHGFLQVHDSAINNFGGGICVALGSGKVDGSMGNVSLFGNETGLAAEASGTGDIRLALHEMIIRGGSTGIYSSGDKAAFWVQESTITGHGFLGLDHPNNGRILSTGGNTVTGNNTDGTFTTIVGKE